MRDRRYLGVFVALALTAFSLVGCRARQSASREVVTSGGSSTATPSSPATEATCTPTRPNGATPPGEKPSSTFYGNGKLFTTLWPEGTVVFEQGGPGEMRPDGSLSMKWPFWRASGTLRIGGRSLHRPGLRVTADIPDGYGDSGFQATGLIFPEPGCYEVTATAGGATLSFVTRVVKR